jgi:hypothetical protein
MFYNNFYGPRYLTGENRKNLVLLSSLQFRKLEETIIWVQGLMPIILTTWEMEIRRI